MFGGFLWSEYFHYKSKVVVLGITQNVALVLFSDIALGGFTNG